MNAEFRTRGARISEQIEVLHALWTEQVVSFHGRWHDLDAAGISPLWMWILTAPDAAARTVIERLRSYVTEAGRSTEDVGLNEFLFAGAVPADRWGEHADRWRHLAQPDLHTVDPKPAASWIVRGDDAADRVADRWVDTRFVGPARSVAARPGGC